MLNILKSPEAKSGREIKNWYKDRYQYALVWRNILAIMTLVSLGISLLSVWAVQQLTPLKSVEPFVIQVDDKTGITQAVNPVTVKEFSAKESVNNFFIVQYLRARETYDLSDLAYNYNVVRVMSEPDAVYSRFLTEVSRENPQSPVNRIGTQGRRNIKIKSISYINAQDGLQTAQVRLSVEEQIREEVKTYQKIATVSFEYANLNLTTDERYINPLDFRVVRYRLDEDAITP